jgi:hypothetical protein
LKRIELLTQVRDAVVQIGDLLVDPWAPTLEVGLHSPEVLDGSEDVIDASIHPRDGLRLLVHLREKERQLLFDLHRDL